MVRYRRVSFVRECKDINIFTNKINNMSKFNYKEQHAVIVKCSSEDEQKEVYERLKKDGYKDLKIVSV